MVLPMFRPISGSCLGPKSKAATPPMTTSSGTPSPKRQRQPRPLELGPGPTTVLRRTDTELRVFVFEKKTEFEEERDEGFDGGRRREADIRDVEQRDNSIL